MPGVKLHVVTVFLLALVSVQSQDTIESAVIKGEDSMSCPSSELLESAKRNLSAAIVQSLPSSSCGGAGWTQVVDLDISDPNQPCPFPWTVFTDKGTRLCSKSSSAYQKCDGIRLPVPDAVGTYTRVCGQVTGYGIGNPLAFAETSINDGYLDGVSLTRGSPRQHIWSWATGNLDPRSRSPCPCDNRYDQDPPSFVENNYFCNYGTILWNGQDCGDGCCTFNSPPYFTATLPVPTSDNLEVRICSISRTPGIGVHISRLQLYVQ